MSIIKSDFLSQNEVPVPRSQSKWQAQAKSGDTYCAFFKSAANLAKSLEAKLTLNPANPMPQSALQALKANRPQPASQNTGVEIVYQPVTKRDPKDKKRWITTLEPVVKPRTQKTLKL